MEQERFQNLVLEHLVRVTQEITEIKTDISELKSDLKQVQDKLELVHTQTAHLTEEMAAVRNENSDQYESIHALTELYGRHEIELNKLQKRPV